MLVAAFTKTIGFTAYYKIYFLVQNITYEAHIAYDKLRNRQYIISFNPIIFSIKQ